MKFQPLLYGYTASSSSKLSQRNQRVPRSSSSLWPRCDGSGQCYPGTMQPSRWFKTRVSRLGPAIALALSCGGKETTEPQCAQAGIYSRGKEGGPSCCPGFNEYSRTAEFETGPGEVSCADPIGHAEFGCIEGSCGDGVCELGEEGPCGCIVDCSVEGSSDIEATRLNAIWVFFHAPSDHDDALYVGVPSVINGCLFIGDAIVVWHEDRAADAEAAVDAALSGETPTVMLGGGGIRLDEGDTPIPKAISERCATRKVWFASPD
jgi:hypothetical protein